jgi:hypothetical protein
LEPSDPIVERAVALGAAGTGPGAGQGRDAALGELIRMAGEQPEPLHQARAVLVGRVRQQSGDYTATGGLTLINAAIARLGWHGDHTWKPRNER